MPTMLDCEDATQYNYYCRVCYLGRRIPNTLIYSTMGATIVVLEYARALESRAIAPPLHTRQ